MQRPNKRIRLAFTLLELIAVLVLLGLISTIAMFSVVGHVEQSELVRLSQELASADRKERYASRQSYLPGGLVFDRSKQRFQYQNSKRTIEVGKRIKTADFIINTLQSDKQSDTQSDKGSVLFAQSGQSPTYAIRLESSRGAMRWVLVIGMTGQVLFTDSIEDVRSVMAMGR